MKFALNSGILPGGWSPAEKLEATARVGADGLELNVDANALWTQRLDRAARHALHQQAQDLGIVWTSLCMNAHWVFNLASPDVRIRDVGVSLLIDAIDLAQDLGASAILVPGCDQAESPENRWELFRDGVLHAIARAERAGVTLALEAVGKPFLFDTQKLQQMIEDCGGSKALGIYLDVGNATHGGMDPAEEIRAAGDRATLVHVKDWNPAVPSERRLGAGAVDMASSFAALAEIGYDGYLIVELSPDPADPDAVARHSVQYLADRLHPADRLHRATTGRPDTLHRATTGRPDTEHPKEANHG
jgi:sugar phosphate isomerase/epimerase